VNVIKPSSEEEDKLKDFLVQKNKDLLNKAREKVEEEAFIQEQVRDINL